MTQPRLLVVDDDWLIASILEHMLREGGYQVQVASDGLSALALLEKDPAFDTILLDRMMPGLDGLEVLARLKADPVLKDIPVVLQTGMDSEEDLKAGLRAGAHYYLVKPLDAKIVLQVVASAIQEVGNRRRFIAEMEGIRAALGLIRRGTFRYQTLQQCHDLAAFLGKACPDPKRSVIGLSELMINALEHGNLGISYADKTQLVEEQRWHQEVMRRQALPESQARWVTVSLHRSEARTRFRIQDMGQGFDWQAFQDIDPERMFDNHGRGILLAKWEAFDRITYVGNGNCVIAEIGTPPPS